MKFGRKRACAVAKEMYIAPRQGTRGQHWLEPVGYEEDVRLEGDTV